MVNQLVMPSGEPRYTKVKGKARYYDHALGKTISHRQYWKLRGQQRPADAWTPEKAARLQKTPAPARAAQAPAPARPAQTGTPSLLAQQLLAESSGMLGSPVVETPPPPSAAKDLATEIADSTRQNVEALAETVTPAVAMLAVAVLVWIAPDYIKPLVPDQDEAELILEPAARIVLRTVGITGTKLGRNGEDMLSLVAALAAYAIGAKARMDDYLASVEDEQEYEQQPSFNPGRRGDQSSASAYDSRPASRNGHSPAPPNDGSASSPAYTAIFGRNSQQVSADTREQASSNGSRSGVAISTAKQAAEASKIRDLFEADYIGRVRLGYAPAGIRN